MMPQGELSLVNVQARESLLAKYLPKINIVLGIQFPAPTPIHTKILE